MKIGKFEETVGVVVGQLGECAHLGDGVNGVADTEVGVSADFSQPWVPRNELKTKNSNYWSET